MRMRSDTLKKNKGIIESPGRNLLPCPFNLTARNKAICYIYIESPLLLFFPLKLHIIQNSDLHGTLGRYFLNRLHALAVDHQIIPHILSNLKHNKYIFWVEFKRLYEVQNLTATFAFQSLPSHRYHFF
jgi:hypothetical protein